MDVLIRSKQLRISTFSRRRISRRVARTLGRFSRSLNTITVSVDDLNGPRGGVDKEVKIQTRLPSGRDVVVLDRKKNVRTALQSALGRMHALLGKDLGRIRSVRRRKGSAKNPRRGAQAVGF